MAKIPDKKAASRVIFGNKEKKQFPDPEGLEREKPSSAVDIDSGQPTPPIGHGTRLRDRFSEQVSEIGIETRHREEMKNKGMRQTFASRSNKRPKHLQHPAPVATSPYKPQHQMERPHYEEVEKMTDKTYSQFIAEAKRGRPRKLRPGEKADTEHLQDQLAKLTHANHVTVHFANGEKHDIPRAHANKALIHLSSLKPIHRADHVEHMHGSKENFYHTLSTGSIPSKKKTITLAGPKLRKEEVEQIDEAAISLSPAHKAAITSHVKKMWGKGNISFDKQDGKHFVSHSDGIQTQVHSIQMKKGVPHVTHFMSMDEEVEHDDDGWYTHREIHGDKGVSREDWKKGIRMTRDGKRVQTKKEEVELAELSDPTLYDYYKKANISRKAANHRAQAGKLEGDKEEYKKQSAKASKRKEGMEKASVRMTAIAGYKPPKKNPYGAKMPASYIKKEEVELEESLKDARKHRRAAQQVGYKHPDYSKHMAAFHRAMAAHASKGNLDDGRMAREHEQAAKSYAKEEVEHIEEWGNKTKAITGPHAKTSAMGITPPKIGYKGKGTKPKAQKLTREDYAPLEDGEKQAHVDQKTVDASSRKQGAEKPKKPKMQLSKEEWDLYDSLSDAHKIIFEKMDQAKRDELMDKYFKSGGKVTRGEYNKPRESEKPWPASKMKGSKWAGTAGRVNRKNQGYKK